MKATDLRIGNLVQNDMGKVRYGKIASFNNKSANLKMEFSKLSTSLNSVDGIPITEEWILKSGFKWSGGFAELKHPEIPLYFLKHPKVKDKYTCFFNTLSIGNIKYIHELQNLYFALKSEELNIESIY